MVSKVVLNLVALVEVRLTLKVMLSGVIMFSGYPFNILLVSRGCLARYASIICSDSWVFSIICSDSSPDP